MVIGQTSSAHAGDLSQHTGRLLAYGLLALFLMAVDYRGGYLDRFHQITREFTEPVFLVLEAPFYWPARLSQWFRDTDQSIAERDALEDQLREQHASLLRMAALGRENEELRRLLNLSQAIDDRFISARVLSVDLNPFSHRLIINQGRVDGIESSMAVVDQGGLIGQIDTVQATTSSVILITDPDHALPVRVARTGAVTLAYGGGLNGDLSLPDLPMNIDLQVGDALESSGLGGVFPEGLPVGVVNRIDRPRGESFAVATAEPVGQHDRSRFVMVLVPSVSAQSELGLEDDPIVEGSVEGEVSEGEATEAEETPNG